jgi:hypothetical protein
MIRRLLLAALPSAIWLIAIAGILEIGERAVARQDIVQQEETWTATRQ